MTIVPISADSHITEPPDCYARFIDPKFRDRAPHVVSDAKRGDTFVIPGMEDKPVPMGLVAAAGKDPSQIRVSGTRFEELHRSGWDPKHRLADQDRDGVGAEILFATVGMLICNHDDVDYRQACMEAYNRWLQEYCAHAPDRLIGMGQAAVKNPAAGIAELERIKEMGFKGVMMSGQPGEADYDDPAYDPFWRAAVELGLPLCFHILTNRADSVASTSTRGPRINTLMQIIRGCQDIMGMLVFSGVFERHPELKVVCVECDAGWVPHYTYRMDHIYKRHRFWNKGQELQRMPSEYFFDNIYLTFQDD
ncbi:MAG TPA: amidohydrolase family protein, partial [Alphaproteobacteria bacterium]|nr:amidohydrolase family protein [Alphaproteobacteria bacterium]